MDAGTYSGFTVNGDNFTSAVTVQSADGTRDAVIDSGITIDNSSFITLKGLDVEGGGIGGDGGVAYLGSSGHDYTLDNDTIANSDYGIIIGSSSGAISNVLVTGSTIHNIDFSGSSAGTGGGQGVSCYSVRDGDHGQPLDLLRGQLALHPVRRLLGPDRRPQPVHLPVQPAFRGASERDADLAGRLGRQLHQQHRLRRRWDGWRERRDMRWLHPVRERARGWGTASDGFTNYDVSNNLFVNSGGSLPIQIQTTTGGTVSNNTVADGFQYGVAIGFNGVTGVESTGLVSQYNIVTAAESGQDYRYGCDGSGCVSDYNVSADSTATGTGSIDGWAEDWETTTWNNPATTPMPAGFYVPADLGSGVRLPGLDRPLTAPRSGGMPYAVWLGRLHHAVHQCG